MQQVVVRKQGRYDYSSWSSRVLTVDSATGVLLLSKKGAPEQLTHHAMQPTKIQVWPHYNSKYVDEDFNSIEAKLTIRLAGDAYPPKRSADAESHMGSDTLRKMRVLNSAGTEADEAWVLRFTSLDDYRAALLELEKLTVLASREKSLGNIEETEHATTTAHLPASATELLKPIRRAWLLNELKKQEKRDAVTVF